MAEGEARGAVESWYAKALLVTFLAFLYRAVRCLLELLVLTWRSG
jgi:hypothetical protein